MDSVKVCNMHVERLLALCKMVATLRGQSLPTMERAVSCGMLAQLLNVHVTAGGDDPRLVTRRSMIRDGVPIEAAPRKKDKAWWHDRPIARSHSPQTGCC